MPNRPDDLAVSVEPRNRAGVAVPAPAATLRAEPGTVSGIADIANAAPCPQADYINDKERRLMEDANSWYSRDQKEEMSRKRVRRRDREADIKAPDGYTLGGMRLVRADGTILFNRGWWQAPVAWAGQIVWVHEEWSSSPYAFRDKLMLEAAHPGYHIYNARVMKPPKTVICERTERPDAKPAFRNPARKAFAAKGASL